MKMCDECGHRPANIHLTQIVDDESQSFHLCEECAEKRGIQVSIDDEPVSSGATANVSTQGMEDIECTSCRMKLSEFKTKGWLGCPACYQSFEKEIEQLLLHVHGSSEHKGKKYHRHLIEKTGDADLSKLRLKLDAAIKNEEFERAALLRDVIHGLKDPGKK